MSREQRNHHSCQNSSRCFCFRAAQRGITDAKPTFDKITWLGLPGLNNLFYVSKTSLNCSLLQRLLKLLLWGAQQRISCCRGSCSRKLKGSKLQNKSAGLSKQRGERFFLWRQTFVQTAESDCWSIAANPQMREVSGGLTFTFMAKLCTCADVQCTGQSTLVSQALLQ